MPAEWFVLSNNQQIGPYTKDQLIALMQQGSLIPTSYVRRLDGPWITIAQAFLQLVVSASTPPATTEIRSAIEAHSPRPALAYDSTSSQRYYRKKKTSTAGMFGMVVAVLIGGVAAVFTAKQLGLLFPRAAPPVEPEVIVIPAPTYATKVRRTESDDELLPKQLPPRRSAAVASPQLAKLDPSPTPPPGIEEVKKDDPQAEAWLARIRELFLERDDLIVKLNELQQQIQPLIDESRTIEARFKDLRRQENAISVKVRSLQDTLKNLYFARSQNINVDAQISAVEGNISSLVGEHRSLDDQAQPLRVRIDELTSALVPLKQSRVKLLVNMDRLRDDTIWHLNPFAVVSAAVSEAANKYFDELAKQESSLDQGWSHFGRGCFAMRNGDLAKANKSFLLAIECLPGEATFLAVRGACRAKAGQTDEGLQDLIAAAKKDTGNRTVSYMYAIVQCRRGAYSGAEDKLRECLKLDESYARAKRFLSLLKSATDDAKVRHANFAFIQANEVIARDETSNAHFVIASAHAASERFEEAIKHVRHAIAGASSTELPWYQDAEQSFLANKPLRIDWKTFNLWASL